MKKIGTALALICGLLGSATQVACFEEAADDASPGGSTAGAAADGGTVTPSVDKVTIRVVHASANAPAVDVYAVGSATPLVTNLAFGQTSGWLEVPPGTYDFELRAAPSKPSDPIAYKTGPLQIPAGAKVSAVAAGLLGETKTDAAFRVLPLVERWGAKEAGKVRVRVVHAGADAPAVGIDVGNDNPALPEVASLARFSDTGGEGVALPAGAALPVGITLDGKRVTAFTTPTLPDGSDVLMIATGLLAKTPRASDGFALLAVGPNGSIGFVKQDPTVYALHAGADAPRVDAFAGNAELIDDLGFGELSGALQVQPGSYTLDFFGHAEGTARPAGAPAASASTGALSAGERYLAIATGLLAGSSAQSFRLVAATEGFDPASTAARIRAVHASPDAPAVDVGLVSGGAITPVLFGDVKFTDASAADGAEAPAGHLPVGVTPAGQNSAIVARFTFPVVSTSRVIAVASGLLSPRDGSQAFRFLAVETSSTPWKVTTISPH